MHFPVFQVQSLKQMCSEKYTKHYLQGSASQQYFEEYSEKSA